MINDMKENIARSLWEGNVIMGTDGSVKNSKATYSYVISMSNTNVNTNIKGGGFLPLTPQYMDPYSKCTGSGIACWPPMGATPPCPPPKPK
jgi:hypothetical protein